VAKVNEEARKKYFARIAPYREIVYKLASKERNISRMLQSDDPGAVYKRLAIVEVYLTAASYHLAMNALSVSFLGIRSENELSEAKKSCSLAIVQLEKVFTNLIDVPFQDYETSLEATSSFGEFKRYALIRKAGLALSMVKDGFSENSKWRWPLIALEARLAVVAKNCLNLHTLVQGMDPRHEGYRERTEYFKLAQKMLQDAADGYRMKYEMATKRAEDFRLAINFLGALRRLSLLLGRQREANEFKKRSEIWRRNMESESKKQESWFVMNRPQA